MKRLCEVVHAARSSFYAWLDGEPRRVARAAADAELAERIRVVHERDRTQGAPRDTAEFNDAPVGAENPVTSCDLHVLVYVAAKPGSSQRPDGCSGERGSGACGHALMQRSVGPVRVAMLGELA